MKYVYILKVLNDLLQNALKITIKLIALFNFVFKISDAFLNFVIEFFNLDLKYSHSIN